MKNKDFLPFALMQLNRNIESILKKVIITGVFIVIIKQSCVSQIKLPSIDYLPQSPSAAAFSRYGEIPVDHSTGVPKIEIPIYTVKVGDVEVPITISYHASGIKVRDVASEVGLGFVLNTGGVITTTIIGKPDIENLWPIGPDSYRQSSDIDNAIYNAYASNNQATIQALAEYYWKRINPEADYHPIVDNFSDRFFYSLCTGESGIFRKDFISGAIRFMPYRPVNVNIHDIFIDIISQNGYKHYFKSISTNKDYYALDKVVSADKTDSIQYYYHEEYYHRLNVNYSVTWQSEEPYLDYQGPCMGSPPGCIPCLKKRMATFPNDPDADGGMESNAFPLMDSMVTKNEVIHFEYIKDRYDDVMGTFSFPSYWRLVKISVKDRNTRQTIKAYNFSHSYFGTAANHNRRLKLDNISVSGLTSSVVENYSFNYETSVVLPEYPHINGAYIDNIWHEDYWGYYNGSSSNNLFPSFVSSFNIPGSTIQYGDLEPQWTYGKACLLTGITYPTGGKTIFEYEPNYLQPNHLGGIVGGARVRKITSYTDAASQAFVKTYVYDGAQTNPIVPAYYKWDMPEEHYVWHKNINCTVWSYEYYTVNKAFSNSLRPITINGAPIIYTSVTEYSGDETTNTGKIVYGYEYPENPDSRYPIPGNVDTRYISYFHSDCGNYIPQLTGKFIYKYNNGNYDLVKSESHTYTKHHQNEFNTGISLASKIILHGWGVGAQTPQYMLWNYDAQFYPQSGYLSSLVYTDTKAFEEVSLLTNSVVKSYSGSGTYAEIATTYEYDNNLALLTRKTTTGSKGEVLRTDYKHPSDFSVQAPYSTMVSRNILTPVIERSEFKDNNFLQSLKTNYDYWNGTAWSAPATNIIVPRTVETKTLNENPEIRIRYSTYDDKGNATTVSKENDVKNSYIWGYNKSHPIASVVNAEAKDIFHTSFEEGTGNSLTGDSKTGKKSKTDGFSKPLSNLTNGNYTLSYWQKSGSNWILQMSTVSVTTSAYNINLAGQVDEVRFYPEKALMTTYTYTPLVGMISQCSPDNRVTYYEYDGFSRLVLIRDQDRNIVKKFCYTYTGQTENCQFFANADLSNNYYKQDCPSGQTALPYYVSVPPGMFTSTLSIEDANNQALQYAQQQANLYGSCQVLIQMNYNNYAGTTDYVVELTNTVTSTIYWLNVGTGSGVLGAVEAGTYNVSVYNLYSIPDNDDFMLCNNWAYNQNYAYFPNITINISCNTLNIY